MSNSRVISSAEIQAKAPNGAVSVEGRFSHAPVADLLCAGPWRVFRWHRGQRHYSGSYWSATESSHVIYESRLELARLLFADFDPSVSRIVAQPFLMTAHVDGAGRRHIPDFLLMTEFGPLVVDVKPTRRLARPEVAFSFAWAKTVIESRGWGYEVWTGPNVQRLENIGSLRVIADHHCSRPIWWAQSRWRYRMVRHWPTPSPRCQISIRGSCVLGCFT